MLLRRRSEKAEALRQVPLFANLSQRHLDLVAREADEVPVEAGAMLARQGGLGHEFLLILDGRARVERDGKTIARLRPGDFFGEMSLIDGEPRSASVVAETPVTLLCIHGRAFNGLIETVPGLHKQLLRTLCERLRAADAALARRN